MKTHADSSTLIGCRLCRKSGQQGLTLVELIIIVALIVVLLAMLMPALSRPNRRPRISCTLNLKQIGLSFTTWSLDNGRKFPMGISTNFGGSLEISTSALTPHFTVMSNELSTPRMLVCGSDKGRTFATNFSAFSDQNISYFLNIAAVDASAPEALLAGDWNITNATTARARVVKLNGSETVAWDHRVHQGRGNILRADGSVGQFVSGRMPPLKTNAMILLPLPVPKWSFWK